jgi:hypothetical protein
MSRKYKFWPFPMLKSLTFQNQYQRKFYSKWIEISIGENNNFKMKDGGEIGSGNLFAICRFSLLCPGPPYWNPSMSMRNNLPGTFLFMKKPLKHTIIYFFSVFAFYS